MKFLLDTHLLLWAADETQLLPKGAMKVVADAENQLFFSVANIWEVAIKYGLEKRTLGIHPRVLRRSLLDHGYIELAITSEHAFVIPTLPPIHRDPFDRILIAQAIAEGITLLTHDATVAQYPGPIQLI